jgi:TP901 family phage tail tape measure protein
MVAGGTQVASLFALLDLNDQGFKRKIGEARSEMQGAQGMLGGLSSSLQSVGGGLQRTGMSMMQATAPLAAGLGAGIYAAQGFRERMANVNAILGVTGEEADALADQILDFGATTRSGPMAAAEAYYAIVSGVQDASAHMAILEASSRTAEAGQADLMATTSGLISVMNSFKFGQEDAARVSDVMTRTVGMGVMTMDELAAAMPAATSIANTMGVEFEDLAAYMAYMTTQGKTASVASTELRGVMMAMMNPTTELQEAIEGLGYESGQSMVSSVGLEEALRQIREYGGGSFAGIITSTEAMGAAIALTDDTAAGFFGDYMEGVDGATERAAGIQDSAGTWDELRVKMETLAIKIGEKLIPVIDDLWNNYVEPFVTALIAWIDENRELTAVIALVAGGLVVLGPLLMGAGALVSTLGAVLGVAAAAATALSSGMLVAVAPIVAVGAAVLGVIAAIHEFNRITGEAKAAAQEAAAPLIESGQLTEQQLYDQAFASTAWGFGGGLGGDIMARLFYTNFAKDVQGDSAFGGGKALGGPVSTGVPYLVGERGPELFVPGASGTIVPNGGFGETYNITIYANDEAGGRAAARGFEAQMDAMRQMRG